jgi:hypothetical protein
MRLLIGLTLSDNYDLDYFLNYLTIYHIDDVMFPIGSWNHYNNDDEKITTLKSIIQNCLDIYYHTPIFGN